MSQRRTRRVPLEEEQLNSADLKEEIRLLRDLVHRTAAEADGEVGAAERLRLLDVVARAGGQLARLLRVQSTLGESDDLAEEIGRVAEEIRQRIAGQVEE
jgi:hypothetical protein